MATSKSTTTAKKPAARTTVTSKATTKTATAKKPATTVKKPAAKVSKPAAAPVAAKKPAVPAKAAPAKAPAALSPEQRYKMVQDAAYFIAERNGFKAGSMDYWIAAEAEITALLSSKK
jgi:Protein of unknown function (DUF2934)